MSRFTVAELPLKGLKTIQRQRLGDDRGFLSRLFCVDELGEAGWTKPVAQINHTYTEKRGTVRGLHFQQAPHAEMKLVSCIKGEVWDVAVDIRSGSKTFLHWHAEILSSKNSRAMLIPEGFAHGFQSISDDVELVYCHSSVYNSEFENGLNPKDNHLAIDWPLEITELSDRDRKHRMIENDFKGLML